MTDEERDALLLEIRERLERIDARLNTHGERLERIEGKQAMQGGQLAALARDVETLGQETLREHGDQAAPAP